MFAFALLALLAATPAPRAAAHAPRPAATSTPEALPAPSPQRLLGLIRLQFRSHRPPPPYVTYTFIRKQNATNGYPDPTGTYTRRLWVRSSDRAALSRFVYRDEAEGPLEFDRPAFNEARDPGPPTADVFEPAPARPHPVSEVPTPEPNFSAPPVIGGVRTLVELDYRVDAVTTEGGELHLRISPARDADRNRLREIWVDKKTLELHKLVATDKLFVPGDKTYGTTFTITMGQVDGIPVVTHIDAIVGDGYSGDGQRIIGDFKDIAFPATLPDWYFNARTYAAHGNDAPV